MSGRRARRRRLARASAAALVAIAALAPRHAGADDEGSTLRETVLAYRIGARLRAPASVPYDPTRLGHVVLEAKLALTNKSATTAPLGQRELRWTARGAVATYPCEAAPRESDRWPAALPAGDTFVIEREAACDTVLPGPHVLEVRWAGEPDTDAPLASTPFDIEPGPNAPVPLSTRPGLRVVVSGTREARPSTVPGRVRIVLGLVNATAAPLSLPSVIVHTGLHMRGSSVTCRDDRRVELSGALPPGKLHVVWMPLACALPYEGIWETDVDVGEPGAPTVRAPRHTVRVQEVQPPPPRPPFR